MIEWWLRGAALLAILSMLPPRTGERTVCLIGRWCLGAGLACMVGLPVASALDSIIPRGLPLSTLVLSVKLFEIGTSSHHRWAGDPSGSNSAMGLGGAPHCVEAECSRDRRKTMSRSLAARCFPAYVNAMLLPASYRFMVLLIAGIICCSASPDARRGCRGDTKASDSRRIPAGHRSSCRR